MLLFMLTLKRLQASFLPTGLDVMVFARANQFKLNLLQLTRLTQSCGQNSVGENKRRSLAYFLQTILSTGLD